MAVFHFKNCIFSTQFEVIEVIALCKVWLHALTMQANVDVGSDNANWILADSKCASLVELLRTAIHDN